MNYKDPKMIFLVWAPFSIRSQNLSEKLNAKLFLLNYKFKKKIYSPIKYPLLFAKTLNILAKEKPDVIIIQIPPIFCIIPVVMYKKLIAMKKRQCCIVIDAHTGAFGKPWSYLKPLNKLLMKSSSLLIVTNKQLQNKVLQDYDINTTILEDRIPNPGISSCANNPYKDTSAKQGGYYANKIAFVCSFAPDEPLENVLSVAALLPKVQFYVTGDHSRIQNKKQILDQKTENVVFTGFMSYDEYMSLLQCVDAVIVLTNRDQTMLSGAYETMAVGKPLITSNWACLQQYYDKGTICTDNSPEGIKKAIVTALAKKEQLVKEMVQLKDERSKEWDERFFDLKSQILNNYDNLLK
jgi:glycosyltransferase involved in cell wall biosynthesis